VDTAGYNINAFFLAVNIFTTIDQGLQVMLAAVIARWLRNPISGHGIFYLSFLILAWITVSWALLLPLLTPPQTTTLVVGFFMAFFGLLFSGGLPPIEYQGKAISSFPFVSEGAC
jgi:hypothetical protein